MRDSRHRDSKRARASPASSARLRCCLRSGPTAKTSWRNNVDQLYVEAGSDRGQAVDRGLRSERGGSSTRREAAANASYCRRRWRSAWLYREARARFRSRTARGRRGTRTSRARQPHGWRIRDAAQRAHDGARRYPKGHAGSRHSERQPSERHGWHREGENHGLVASRTKASNASGAAARRPVSRAPRGHRDGGPGIARARTGQVIRMVAPGSTGIALLSCRRSGVEHARR